MKLRDQIIKDASGVFLNPDEFSERITIESVEDVPAICDWSVAPGGENVWGSNEGSGGYTDGTWGINTVHAVITIPAETIPCPEPGQILEINGRNWTVQHAEADRGLLDIKLMRNVA